MELATTLLDVLGLLLIAAGVCALTWPWLGWTGLIPSGVIVLGGSQAAAWLRKPAPAPPRDEAM